MTDPRTTKAERRCLKRLMESMGIRAYLFSLERDDEGSRYTLNLEYAICSGWYRTTLDLEGSDLALCGDDEAAERRLRLKLERDLPECPVPDRSIK